MTLSTPTITRARSSVSPSLLFAAALTGVVGGLAHAAPILETYNPTLTTYLPAVTTPVQDVRPLHDQRGVNLDGSTRAGPFFAWALAGNPFEQGAPGPGIGGCQMGDLRVDLGTYAPSAIDIALPAPGVGRWVIGRTYNCVQVNSGSSHIDSNGYQGLNWFQTSQPELIFVDNNIEEEDEEEDLLYLVYGADRYVEFQRVEDDSDEFKGKNGAAGVFEFLGGSPETYVYQDPHGTEVYFFGDTGDDKSWQLWKIVDAGDVSGSHTAYVGHRTTAATALTDGFNADGSIKLAFDAAGRRYCYDYDTIDGDSRLVEVLVEVNGGGEWGACGEETMVAKVEYGYYTGSHAFGANGNLRLVTVTTPLTDSGVNLVKKQHYRYYTDAFDPPDDPGYPNQIMMVVDYEGYRKYDWDEDGALNDDTNVDATVDVKSYSSLYVEYDSSRRVNKAFMNGNCGCGGSNNGTHEFTYATHGSYAGTYLTNGAYDNGWGKRTVIEQPDGVFATQYFDETGQPLSRIVTNSDPAGSPTKRWVTEVIRNGDGQVTEIRSPAANDTYDHSTGAMVGETGIGLITLFARLSSTDLEGFVEETRWKQGTGGTSYLTGATTWTSRTRDTGASGVTRPLVAATKVYPGEETSAGTGALTTDITYDTFYSSTNTDALYLAPKMITTENPTVSTGANGSNSPTSSERHLRKDATPAWTKHPDGNHDYTLYENGLPTRAIRDYDADEGSGLTGFEAGDAPTGGGSFGLTISNAGFHSRTTSAYDPQGRRSVDMLATFRQMKHYYTKIGDGRMVEIVFPRYTAGAPGTLYGPASYTVTNHAGKTEFQGTIAITSSGLADTTDWITEADPDPITALDYGSLARMSTTIHGDSGVRVEETRAYHAIPGSGAGSVGTNYDATTFAYDDMGRKIKSVDPTGTIALTDYDELGRVIKQWIGTDDSGTGSDNMIETTRLEYDGAPGSWGGNSHLTKRTTDPDGDWGTTGDKRETTYVHDVRGRVLLTTNPVAPHILTKHDNMGRAVAVGMYTATGSITPGSTDPAGSGGGDKANRCGLTTTFYDEMGRVWKTQRHQITQSDGTNADNLATLTWYDDEGRVVKVKGETIAKTMYDRLGRPTRRFSIAYDNDSTYADVDDVSGDYVLEESQTVYENAVSGNVIFRAVIARRHDDKYSGSTYATSGALDADGDTALTTLRGQDVKGRPQITAMWHDALDRVTDTVMYGTNGIVGDGTNSNDFTRPGSPPSRSDVELRTTTTYNDDGTVLQVEDPKAIKTRFTYDALGRQLSTIANYVNGAPSGVNAPDDVITRTVYADGLRTRYWLDFDGDNVEDSGDQVTVYTYGTTNGGSAGESIIATGNLLQKVTYPDSASGSDVVTFAYNALGQQVWTKDQAGNILETVYDPGGRQTDRCATTVITPDFDDTVLRISTVYLPRGLVSTVTQWDDETPGSGDELDQVKYTYDDWGNLTNFEQDKNSEVGAGGSTDDYEVAYTLTKATPSGGSTAWRRTTQLLKQVSTTRQTLNFEYDAVGAGYSLDDLAHRVTRVKITSTSAAEYAYVGQGMVVDTLYDEPDAEWALFTGAPATYPDLDRFNRVTTSHWYSKAASADFYDVDVAWDRNSNVVSVTDNLWKNSSGNRQFDALFTVDDLNRLTAADEGTLSGTISNRSRKQEWTLSQAGNWAVYKMDLNGNVNYSDSGEYNDTETFNEANEILTRDTDSNASVNYTQTHDEVGNLTDDGKDYEYFYDVFGRLREVRRTDNQNLVAEYSYNGLGHRIGWHYDADGDSDVDGSDPWYYFAYDEKWRMVATFRDGSAPIEIFTNHCAGRGGYGGSSALDAVICRDKNLDDGWLGGLAENESLEERVYFCQNWRNDVVAVVSSGGQQRVSQRYSAYGVPFAAPAGDLDADGDCDGSDSTILTAWIAAPLYDVRGDLDLDGDVDATDQSTLTGTYSGVSLGRGKLSRGVDLPAGGIRKGYAGYEHDGALLNMSFAHVRNRVYMAEIGRWTRRDPLGYVDGMSLYGYAAHEPITRFDQLGLQLRHVSSVVDETTPGFWLDCGRFPPRTCDRERCDRNQQIWGNYKTSAAPTFQQWQDDIREYQRRIEDANDDYILCIDRAEQDFWLCLAGPLANTVVTECAGASAASAAGVVVGPILWPILAATVCITGTYCDVSLIIDQRRCRQNHDTAVRRANEWYRPRERGYENEILRLKRVRDRQIRDSEEAYVQCINDRGVGAGDP